MNIKFGAALMMMLGMATAGAQVASHAPVVSMPTTASAQPLPKPVMAPPMQVAGKAVARVNGVDLYDRELLREMFTIFPYARQHNGFPKELEPEIRRGALEMIIFEELVYQDAKRRHVAIPPAKLAAAEKEFRSQFPSQAVYREFLKSEVNGSEAAMKEKIRRSLLIEASLKQDVEAPARITTAQAKARYEKNAGEYKHAEVVHIQTISIIPPDTRPATVKEAKQRAEEAFKQAKQAKNFKEFGLLAEKFSDDDYHVNMGNRKPLDVGTLPPPLIKALAAMKAGDVSELIQLGDAYTIIRLDSRTPAGITPFSEIQSKLQSEMQKEKTQQIRSALNQKLRQNAKIETL